MENIRLKEAQPLLTLAGRPKGSSNVPVAIVFAVAVAVASAIGWDFYSDRPKTEPTTHGDPNIILKDGDANLELRCYLEKFTQRCSEVFDPRWMEEMCGEYKHDMKFASDIQMTALLRDAEVLGPLDLAGLVGWRCLEKDDGTGMHHVVQSIDGTVLDRLTPEQRAQFILRSEYESGHNVAPSVSPDESNFELPENFNSNV